MRPRRRALEGKTAHQRTLYLQEWLVLDFTEQLCRAMQRKKISRTRLAEILGVSQPYISKVLRGKNLSLPTAAKLATGLGLVLDVRLTPFSRLPS